MHLHRVYGIMGTEPRASCLLDRHSTNWTTSLNWQLCFCMPPWDTCVYTAPGTPENRDKLSPRRPRLTLLWGHPAVPWHGGHFHSLCWVCCSRYPSQQMETAECSYLGVSRWIVVSTVHHPSIIQGFHSHDYISRSFQKASRSNSFSGQSHPSKQL